VQVSSSSRISKKLTAHYRKVLVLPLRRPPLKNLCVPPFFQPKLIILNIFCNDDIVTSQWTESPKNNLKECVYVNSALKIQCHIDKNTFLQTAFSAILSTGIDFLNVFQRVFKVTSEQRCENVVSFIIFRYETTIRELELSQSTLKQQLSDAESEAKEQAEKYTDILQYSQNLTENNVSTKAVVTDLQRRVRDYLNFPPYTMHAWDSMTFKADLLKFEY